MKLLDQIYVDIERMQIPLHVMLEVTHACNLDCIHCCIRGAVDQFRLNHDNNELTLREIERLLDDLVEEGTLNLVFTGGEAFLRKDFLEILALAKKRHFAFTIFSNGQCIDVRTADTLARLLPVCVFFSLYGANAAVHERVTGVRGSFEKLLGAIALLRQRGIVVGLKTMVMKENLSQLKDILSLGRSLGIDQHEFGEEISAKIDGSCEPKKMQLDDSLLGVYYRSDTPELPEYREALSSEEALKKPLCGAGVFGATISCYGDVYPCGEWRAPVGNIRQGSFRSIWRKKEGLLAELRTAKEYGDLEDCRRCGLVDSCRRCPGRAFAETGRWRASYPNAYSRAVLERKINQELEARQDGKEEIRETGGQGGEAVSSRGQNVL
jgi:radical SAM protein with 4Fe4S-binding SPASM domain